MNTRMGLVNRIYLWVGLLPVTALLLAWATACGSGGDAGLRDADAGPQGAGVFQKVTPSDRVYVSEDILATGFKKAKEYDVEDLPAATGALFGWWWPGGGEAVDYEVRFYGSHEDAVQYGTSFAEEASGEDAVINSNKATWKEGLRDRRVGIGAQVTGGSGSGGGLAVGPKYFDYAIYANMVILCQGGFPEHSLERCESLIDAVRASGDE